MKFKKILSCVLSVLFMLSLVTIGYADETDGNFQFRLVGSDYAVVGYNGNDPVVRVPDEFNGRIVSEISARAFARNATITEVVLSSNIESIGISSFESCQKLEAVTIPASVRLIGDYAFKDCSSLENITVSSARTEIGVGAFMNCTSLFSVKLPSLSIAYRAFYGCSTLSNIELSASVRSVGAESFSETSWENRYNGDTMYLGKCLYKYRGNDNTVYIESGTRCVADQAFLGNTSLERVVIPNSVYYLGDNCFDGCDNMRSISVPSSVIEIGNRAYGFGSDGSTVDNFVVYCMSGSLAESKAISSRLTVQLIDNHEHEFTEWKIKTPVTCETDGVKVRECLMCNLAETETILHEGHKWSETEIISPATCTSDGIAIRQCTVCQKQERISKLATGHTFSEWTIDEEATCISKGKRTHHCLSCGYEESERTDKLPHNWVQNEDTDEDGWIVLKAPTCTMGGSKQRTCQDCKYIETMILNKLDHNVPDWLVTRGATTYREGERTGECSVCGQKVTQKIEKKPETLPQTVDKIQLISGSDLAFGPWKSPSGVGTLVVPSGTTVDECLGELKYPGHMVLLDKNGTDVITDFDSYVATGTYISLVVDPNNIDTNVNIIQTVVVVVMGDVNGDGLLDAKDARTALRISAELERVSQIAFRAADVDENDEIEAKDARKILRVSAQLEKL